jgi:hypothetical protein
LVGPSPSRKCETTRVRCFCVHTERTLGSNMCTLIRSNPG